MEVLIAGVSGIDVFADRARWRPAADADRRELHLSLGDRVAQHMFCLGHAEAAKRSYPRRPLGEILVK